jgi:hypothetical protein
LASWHYSDLPRALGCDGWFTARVTTCGEFDQALQVAEQANTAAYIEVVTDKYASGIRRIFWNGCKILEPCELEGAPYGRLAEAFPALRHRGGDPDPDAYVKAVNDLIVDESLLEIGILNFAGSTAAKALISSWRVEPGQRVLTGEFSFQIKYDPGRGSVGPIANLSESFYVELQSRLGGWTAASSTKVRALYRLRQTAESTRAQAGSMMLV